MEDYLHDNDAMTKVSDGFSIRSNGVFKGAIGALDGWLVRILCPSLQRDGIKILQHSFQGRAFMHSMCK